MPTLVERLKEVFSSEKSQRDASERAALESWAIAQQRLSLDANARAALTATAEVKAVRTAQEEYAVPIFATTDSAKSILTEARLTAAQIESYTRVDGNGVAWTYVHKDDVEDARATLVAAHTAALHQGKDKQADQQASYSVGM